ncbi:MAG: ABC transporter permease [Solirubrobacteraceae bacterium]
MLVARDVEVSVTDGVLILGPVSLDVAPGSLVALMGSSGSGKSTLLRVLAGIAEPTAGTATWAAHSTASSVQALGYVPQRESVHGRLTTREALHYAACLRLGTGEAIEERVGTVLDELGLVGQADTLIRNLSGGERRRAACGLELVGDPPVLLLDEPTSGLDTVLERRLMHLFRRLADHGRAVLVATHATASLDLCDEVVVLQAGLAGYRGSPSEARVHLAAVAQDPQRASDADRPIASAISGNVHVATRPASVLDGSADGSAGGGPAPLTARRPFGFELRVLAGRYFRTLKRDRRTLALLVGQAPVIGVLVAIVFHSGAVSTSATSPLDAIVLVFLIMTGSIWLGVATACREVVKERGLVEREFDVGVRLDAYVAAKALVLFALNFVQVLLLTLVVVGLQPLGVGPGAVVELFAIAVLTAWASAAMGLAVSCAARSVDQASGAVPLLLMPQLLLAGGLIPLAQMPRIAAALANLIYARWSFAGLASAARIGSRLSAYDYSQALGFSNGFFSLTPGAAAVILIAFTLVGLLAAVFFLTSRPAVGP